MIKAFFIGLLSSQLLTIAQENWGKINFQTRFIPKTNGEGTYDVPLPDYNSGAGLGSVTGGATVGLFFLIRPSYLRQVQWDDPSPVVLRGQTRIANE